MIRQSVPNTTGYTGYRLELRDVMGAGLDLTGEPKVTVDGKSLDAGLYEYTRDGRTLTWAFGAVNDAVSPAVRDILKGDAAATFKPGAEIRIEYSAVVNSDAVRPGAARNTIGLGYSNNPNAWDKGMGSLPGGSPDDTSRPTEVLLGSATPHATGTDGKTGVGGVVVQITRPGSTEPLTWIRNPDGSYTLADRDDRDTVTEPTSKDNGDIILHGVNGQLQVTQKGGTGADFRVTVNAGRDPATGQTVTTVTLDTGHNRDNLARQTDAETVSWTAVAGGPAGHDGGGLANTGVTWAAAGAGAAALLAAAGAALAVTRRRAGR